jgi:hypothetical protein
MSAVGVIKRSALCAVAVACAMAGGGTSSALALSPWWHLTSGSRPTRIQPGVAKNEVQELTVSATSGKLLLEHVQKGEIVGASIVKFDASDEELKANLEELYGAGNVLVTGGPGDAGGSRPYVVTFTGELADQQVEPMQALNSFPFIPGVKLEGGREEATVTEKTKGVADGVIVATAANLGDGDANGETIPIHIGDKLPEGLRAVAIEAIAGNAGSESAGPVECSLEALTCTFAGILPPYDEIEAVISVIAEKPSSNVSNEIDVSGGEAHEAAIARPLSVGGEPSGFGVEDYEMAPEEEGGALDTQAGSHPFQLTTTFTLNQTADTDPVAPAKDLHFKLPPGLIGNPTPFPQCTLTDFNKHGIRTEGKSEVEPLNECAPETAVGVALITISGADVLLDKGAYTYTVPVFSLEPAVGEPARFGFTLLESPVILDTALRTGGDYGVTVNVNNITQTAAFVKSEVTFWGVPGDPRHDDQRGWVCLADVRKAEFPGPCNSTDAPHPPPLLSMPTSCVGTPLQTSVEAASWTQSGHFLTVPSSQPMPTLDGCNRLPFASTISVAPDGQAGSTPTGLTVGLHVQQGSSLNPTGLAESQVKDTTVTLPEGVALNPAAADGLQACSEAQVALNEDVPAGCPESSKVATAEIKSPLLPEPLVGEVYLAARNANPFGSLVALYLVAEDPTAGVLVKVAGEVKPDPVTGQLVSTFKNTPQLPFEDLKLHFFGGSRAPLNSPGLCGGYTTQASIAPWSGNAAAEASSEFQILSGPNGIGCANPLPFNPYMTGGTTNIQAGGFSPFTMTVSREDGQQPIKTFQLHMPPGVSGLLTGVKLCGEAEADAGTCGPESLIGETTVSVGDGGDPFAVTGGKVYITGPYEGAPFGVSVVVRAKAGPYDFGNVIVRGAIQVDPINAALTVTIDSTGPYKIPTILDGIPLQIRHINFTTTRPGFTFNPTDCDAMSVTGTMSSTEGTTVPLSVPFQVTNCAVLGFKPGFKVSTAGKTSRAKGASLSVKLTYPKVPFGSQSNIKSVKVDLPKQLPSRLTTLQKACTAAQFQSNPAGCPAASMVGHATAITPLIPVPLTGPAYFVSYGGAKFPELVIVLQGYGVTLDLHGETFINKAGITSSTFHTVPDAPVGSFELTLPQGPYSALAANGNLCTTKKLTMPTSFVAQNGATIKQSTPIAVTGCAKHKKAKKATHKSRHKHRKK